jgi:hypothetical protein
MNCTRAGHSYPRVIGGWAFEIDQPASVHILGGTSTLSSSTSSSSSPTPLHNDSDAHASLAAMGTARIAQPVVHVTVARKDSQLIDATDRALLLDTCRVCKSIMRSVCVCVWYNRLTVYQSINHRNGVVRKY